MMNSGNNANNLFSGSGQKLYKKAKNFIPGGTQLLSKRPEMFAPELWPAYFSKAKGCNVWDLDGNEFTDMSIMGIGSNILGYADDDVDNAVIHAIKSGISSTLNCPEEVELAELLTAIHPWAHMVRYARSGGEAMALAIRVARAYSERDIVLFSGYHGWTDWYLAANLGDSTALDGQLMPGLAPCGVPRSLKNTSVPFFFNDIKNLKDKIRGKEREIAAFVVEPARGEEAPKEYLNKLNDLAHEIGAVVIYDEITTGFRMNAGGIHLRYGVNPDMAVFAKSMANGYAMSAVIGTEKVMQAAQKTFLSSTNWTERIGPTAAIATIKKYQEKNVAEHIISIGNAIQGVWKEKAQKHHLDIHVSGIPTLCHLGFSDDAALRIATFFTIEMLKRGFLGYRQFKPSFAHTKKDVNTYATAVDEIFEQISASKPFNLLKSAPAQQGFHRLTKE
jgi:glutamate-1-semialdehyde 2,1-aminomutase